MQLLQLLETLGHKEALPALSPHWDESEKTFPRGLPRFLEWDNIREQREFARLPVELDEVLRVTAEKVFASEELTRLAWHCNHLTFAVDDYNDAERKDWPLLGEMLGEHSGAFYLLVALDAVPRTRVVHERLGIPVEISRDTFSHYPESMHYYAMHHGGRIGILPQTLGWLKNHVRGDLYRLGRLEYMLKPFRGELKVWRNRATSEVKALALSGVVFAGDGMLAPNDGRDAWTAQLREMEDSVCGNPISPLGHALKKTVVLPRQEWDLVLQPGDLILETHIPEDGGSMTPERCRESMRRALEFFPSYFPGKPFVGFACASWILNPELETILRFESNILRWQRELYLYPLRCGNRDGLYFIFGEDNPDPETAPRNTRLQRALLDHIAGGGRLLAGGMFMLTEDFAAYGTRRYRSF